MIYYDLKNDKIISLSDNDVKVTSNGVKHPTSNGYWAKPLPGGISGTVTILFDYSELKYMREWINETLESISHNINDYRSTIILSTSNKLDKKLMNCYPKSLTVYDYENPYGSYPGKFEVTFHYDLIIIDDFSSDLVALNRDRKIDSILG